MMGNQKTLTVSILGKSYSLVTDEKSEVVEEAARLIESLLRKMSGTSTSPAEMVKITTFVALKFAVDFIKEQNELQAISSKAAKLNDLIEDSLA